MGDIGADADLDISVSTLDGSDVPLFAHLPSKYFRVGQIAQIDRRTSAQERVVMNKLGGDKPFLYLDEAWPMTQNANGDNHRPMTFICQFFHPIYRQFVRLFLNLDDPSEIQFDRIDTTKPYQLTPVPRSNHQVSSLPCYEIVQWIKVKELVDVNTIYDYYTQNPEVFVQDYPEIAGNLATMPPLEQYAMVNQDYLMSEQRPSCPPLKLGGTPYSIEGDTANYLVSGGFLQICHNEDFNLPFVVGHILADDMVWVYEN